MSVEYRQLPDIYKFIFSSVPSDKIVSHPTHKRKKWGLKTLSRVLIMLC